MNIKELYNIGAAMVMTATAMTVAGEHPFVTLTILLVTVSLILNGIPGIWDSPDDLPDSENCEHHDQCSSYRSCHICGKARQFFCYDAVGNAWCWECVHKWESENNKEWIADRSGFSPHADEEKTASSTGTGGDMLPTIQKS
jgi:hypothetical protein